MLREDDEIKLIPTKRTCLFEARFPRSAWAIWRRSMRTPSQADGLC